MRARCLPLEVAAVSEAPSPESVAKNDHQFIKSLRHNRSWRKGSVCGVGCMCCGVMCLCCVVCAMMRKINGGVVVHVRGVVCCLASRAVYCSVLRCGCAWCEKVNYYLTVVVSVLSQHLERPTQTCRIRKTRGHLADFVVDKRS